MSETENVLLLRLVTDSLLYTAMVLAVDVTTRRVGTEEGLSCIIDRGSCCSDEGDCVDERVGVELAENVEEDCCLGAITLIDFRVGKSDEVRIDKDGVGKVDECRVGGIDDVGVGRVVDEVRLGGIDEVRDSTADDVNGSTVVVVSGSSDTE